MRFFTSAITSMQIPSGLLCDLLFQVSFFLLCLHSASDQQCPALVRAPRNYRVLANKTSHGNVEYQINSCLVAHRNAFLDSSFLCLLCLGSLLYFIFIGFFKNIVFSERVEEVLLCVISNSSRNYLEENSNMKLKPFSKEKEQVKILVSSIKLNKLHGH